MALADTLTAVGTVVLAQNGAQPLGSHLFPVSPGAAFAAAAVPVRCLPGDNLAVHVAVAEAPEHSAVVVDAASEPDFGYVDGILAAAARMRGIAGIVVEGCVRDIAGIARSGVPVVSSGVSVREPSSERGGAVGQEILLGEGRSQPVRRGDWIVADDDGTAVLPRGRATAIMADAIAAVEREQAVLQALFSGRSTLDVLNLDPTRVTGWSGGPVPASAAGSR